MNQNLLPQLQAAFEDPRLIDEIKSVGRCKKVKAGALVAGQDAPGDEIPIVISGLLKVLRPDKNGREILLYFLEGGDTCAMSINCCIEKKKSDFKVIAEEDSVLWMVPMYSLDQWITKYHSFRRYVFNAYQERFEEMLQTVDSLVFLKLDKRLYKYLLDKKQASRSFVIHKTHEQIARELNTSRVVVSRLLKQLEREEKIEQRRNYIEVL